MSAKNHDENQQAPATLECPGPNCIIAVEVLQRVERDVNAILICLKGDPELGHRGLVRRVDEGDVNHAKLTAKVDGMDRKLLVWSGILTGAWAVLSFAWSKLFK